MQANRQIGSEKREPYSVPSGNHLPLPSMNMM